MSLSGQGILLPVTVPANIGEILRDDAGLVDGSLSLLEPGHDFDTLAAGAIPATGSVGYNIAWREALVNLNAARLAAATAAGVGGTTAFGVVPAGGFVPYGPADRAIVDMTFTLGAGWTAATGKLGRTAKGSLEGVVSLAADISTTFAAFFDALAVRQVIDYRVNAYLAASDEFAEYLHFEVTRQGVAGGSPISGVWATSNGSGLIQISPTSNSPGAGSGLDIAGTPVVLPGPGLQDVGVQMLRANGARTWAVNTDPAGSAMTAATGWGAIPPFTQTHKAMSYVLRRRHRVDLSIGDKGLPISFAAMLAKEQAVAASRYAVGGQWNNDPRLIDPATLA